MALLITMRVYCCICLNRPGCCVVGAASFEFSFLFFSLSRRVAPSLSAALVSPTPSRLTRLVLRPPPPRFHPPRPAPAPATAADAPVLSAAAHSSVFLSRRRRPHSLARHAGQQLEVAHRVAAGAGQSAQRTWMRAKLEGERRVRRRPCSDSTSPAVRRLPWDAVRRWHRAAQMRRHSMGTAKRCQRSHNTHMWIHAALCDSCATLTAGWSEAQSGGAERQRRGCGCQLQCGCNHGGSVSQSTDAHATGGVEPTWGASGPLAHPLALIDFVPAVSAAPA